MSTWHELEREDKVRLRTVADDTYDVDQLLGESFCPKASPDIDPALLKEQRAKVVRSIDIEGVWGIVGEFRCDKCGAWMTADSVWGFIGDAWEGSGYDDDVKDATIKAWKEAQ